MKKILMFSIFLSFLSFGREIIGNTVFLENEDIHVLETNDKANQYLENKYPGKYFVEINDDKVYIYPKIEYIKINSEVTSEEEILKYIPSLYIGKVIKDDTKLVDNKDLEILNANKNIYLYTRMAIDEKGRYGAIIDEYVEKDLSLNFDLNLSNINSTFNMNIQKTNFNKGDIFNFDAGILTTEFKPKLEAEYILNDSRFHNTYSLKIGYNNKMYMSGDLKKYIYSSEKDGSLELIILNPEIGFDYLDKSYVYSEFNMNYRYRNNNYIKLDTKGGLGFRKKLSNSPLEPYVKSSLVLEYEGTMPKIYLKGILNFNLMKGDNQSNFVLDDLIYSNNIKGDLLIGFKSKISIPKIYFSNMYVFNDFYLSKKYGLAEYKYISNIGVGFETDFFDNMNIRAEFGKYYKNKSSSFLFNLGLKMDY